MNFLIANRIGKSISINLSKSSCHAGYAESGDGRHRARTGGRGSGSRGGAADAALGAGLDHRAGDFDDIRLAIGQVDAALHRRHAATDDRARRAAGLGGLAHGATQRAAAGGAGALGQRFGTLRRHAGAGHALGNTRLFGGLVEGLGAFL